MILQVTDAGLVVFTHRIIQLPTIKGVSLVKYAFRGMCTGGGVGGMSEGIYIEAIIFAHNINVNQMHICTWELVQHVLFNLKK